MAAALRLTFGAPVLCEDGAAGNVTRILLNPVSLTVTHLAVVSEAHPRGVLAPVRDVTTDGDSVTLPCTLAQLATFESATAARILPSPDEAAGYQVSSYPRPGSVGGSLGRAGLMSSGELNDRRVQWVDHAPNGEVDLGGALQASDGLIGQVRGLLSDLEQRITHILLAEGHLWSRKVASIPTSAVTSIEDGVPRLSLSRSDVHQLLTLAAENAD